MGGFLGLLNKLCSERYSPETTEGRVDSLSLLADRFAQFGAVQDRRCIVIHSGQAKLFVW